MTSATDTSAPTLEQRRAKHAWEAVQRVVQAMQNGTEGDKAKARDFGGQAKRLPMRIMAAGLGQALTFLLAKKYAPNLLEAIGDWVLDVPTRIASGHAPQHQTPSFSKLSTVTRISCAGPRMKRWPTCAG